MNSTVLLAAVLILLSGSVAVSSADDRVTASREALRDFAGELKGELIAAMKEGGPVNAVSVCSEKAPGIAARVSREKGWEVGRTSLRVRNPRNAPDDWEAKVLESFEERRRQGEDPGTMEHSEVVKEDGKSLFRYMKAIPAGELCLTCHGKDIDPGLSARISELYPEDRATGFSLGEIRGAFTITWPVP